MAYGHAERNLEIIRRLEADTRRLLGSLSQLDQEQQAWLSGADPSVQTDAAGSAREMEQHLEGPRSMRYLVRGPVQGDIAV